MSVLGWLQVRSDETYSVNEGCLGQQRLRATCIVANAISGLTTVKLIRRLHDVFYLRFHVIEELHAATSDLKI
jgi:hypothetical protein